jgi:hypothetical protein
VLLSLEFFIEIEEEFNRRYKYGKRVLDKNNIGENEADSKEKERADQYFHKAIFDGFNHALDLERPYKERGQPVPWSK